MSVVSLSLVVEDGTGLINSNSYVTTSTVDAYWTARGGTAPLWLTYDQPTKNAAVMNASMWLDDAFRNSFKGYRTTRTQAMEWPRLAVLDEFGFPFAPVPAEVIYATCEAALRAAAGALIPDLDRGNLIEEQGAGSVHVKYMAGAPGLPSYPWIARILTRLCTSQGGIKLTR